MNCGAFLWVFTIRIHFGGDEILSGKKIKVRKKDSERAEELLGKTDLLVEWIQRNRQLVIGLVVGVVLVPLVFWGYSWYGQSQDEAALRAYTQARQQLPVAEAAGGGVPDASLEELARIAKDYGNSKIAALACMDLGRTYYAAGDFEKAFGWFDEATKHLPQDSLLSLLASYHAALCYREQGKTEEAAGLLATIQDRIPAELKREFHWQAGLTYDAGKDYQKALENYQRALEAEGTYPPKPLLEKRRLADQRKLGSADKS